MFMVYRSTEEVVQRVLPLLERLADRTIDKARLLQYLSARAGEHWGVLELVDEQNVRDEGGELYRVLQYRDTASGAESTIRYPDCLDPELDQLVQDEYRRLAVARPLTAMNRSLFEALFFESHCQRCRWTGPEHEQIHFECHFAGHPVNFEELN